MNAIWDDLGLCPSCREKVKAYFTRLAGLEGPAAAIRDKGLDRFRQELLGQFPMRVSNVIGQWSLGRILRTTRHDYLHRVRGFGLESVAAIVEVLRRNGLKPGMSKDELEALGIPADQR